MFYIYAFSLCGPGLADTRMSPFGIFGAKHDRDDGDNWSCNPCKAPIKLWLPTNEHPTSYRPHALLDT